MQHSVFIPSGASKLEGELILPQKAVGIVLFAHGSGSSRHSPRNQFVAQVMRESQLGTLLFDLLTREEEHIDMVTRHLRFDINLLAKRLVDATDWLATVPQTGRLKIGYFGASTGGAAALVAGAELSDRVGAVVSRGGRPDLAGEALARVKSPTLLIVGQMDEVVLELNRAAYERLECIKALKIVPGATHLFDEPGALEAVAHLAASWFNHHLSAT
jgi:pimeloyl-ACP methyl ester carboxylesterase